MTATRRIAMTLEQCWHRVPGGTAVAALGMARALAARDGLDVRGVAARHSGPPPAAWEPGVPVHQLPLPRLALYESWHHLRWPPVQNATGDVDVIHATTLAIPPRSAPLVVTVHDLAFLHEPGHFTRRGMTFFRRGMKLARRHADLVLCPSRATLEDCAAHGFPRDRLRLVPMAVSQRRADRDEVTAVRARHGLARPYVMWTGTIEPRKNLPRLMAAFAEVDPGVDLVLVGPKGWNEDLQPFVDRLASRVKVLGFVPHEDLPPLYAGAAAFCFPSLFEGFGLPVLEAMVQGTPVVTSRGTSTEELGRDAALLVDPEDVSSIVRALQQALGDGQVSDELRRAGPERAALYTWERTAEALVECYEEAVR